MEIKAKILGKIKFPEFDIDKDLGVVSKEIVIPLLMKGIQKNRDIDGGRFPELSAYTKAKKGHSRPLIDTGTLRRQRERSVLVFIDQLLRSEEHVNEPQSRIEGCL